MSSKEKARDNLSHISLRAVKNTHSSSKAANGSGQTLARLVEDQTKTEYLVRQTRVTVGRSSARSAADVDLGESNFISRNHLEIYLDNGRFFVLVTGKNGIFVDDLFHKKGSPPVELPPE
jgi:forkhead box protein K